MCYHSQRTSSNLFPYALPDRPMKPILIIAATGRELSLLQRTVIGQQQAAIVPQELYGGELGASRVLLAVSGMGKVNAAAAAAALLERFTPGLVIITGCAGAYAGSGLSVGDLVLASTEVFGDEGVLTPSGWEPLRLMGIPVLERHGKSYYNEFPLSLPTTEQAMQLAKALGVTARRGRFVTVSTCSGTTVRGDELASRFGGMCENMEGAAIAQVALAYGVDCIEIRGISNMVEDRDPAAWNIPLAVEQAQRFIVKFIESL
jgi:futalosine hydrolase